MKPHCCFLLWSLGNHHCAPPHKRLIFSSVAASNGAPVRHVRLLNPAP
jgi:hypothetical protein